MFRSSVMIRIFQHGDHVAIAEIFTSAIHQIASECYSEEQCLAWSAREPDYEAWKHRCELKRPFVAIADSEIAGFLELDPDGHIDCAYVNPKYGRHGIMTSLVKHAVDTCFAFGVNRLHVEASICAKPMFEKAGFRMLRENRVTIKGEELLNYKMEMTKQGSTETQACITLPLRTTPFNGLSVLLPGEREFCGHELFEFAVEGR